MRIAYIGNFKKMWDEEYVAQAFERLGHDVGRITEADPEVIRQLKEYNPDVILWAKLNTHYALDIIRWAKDNKVITVCWVWDLYWGYRSIGYMNLPMWKADYVFTSDNGHEQEWKDSGIKHKCIRQGIRKEECYLEPFEDIENKVIFVGSYNALNHDRNNIISQVSKDFDFKWFGKTDTDEVRGPKLNRLYAKSGIIIGDSVWSPYYWSNRVVETLGRGGFLIHVDVPGIKEEYPYLVTYERDNYLDLKNKIGHYLQNPKQRKEIINKNYEWVRDHYTMDHKVQDLCQSLSIKKNSGDTE